MGGYVVLAGWRLAPERFTALGLVASHALADSDEARQGRYQLVEQTIEQGPSAVAETMLPKLFAPQADPEEQHTQVEQVRAMILRTPVLGILGALKGMAARADLTATLPHINVPALVLVGDSDQLIPFARSEAAFKGLPNASLVTIERAGHMPMLEQPQATALAIRNFLAEQHPFKGT
jgi:pimeloyl-ACP methyl ester carboxylesterase